MNTIKPEVILIAVFILSCIGCNNIPINNKLLTVAKIQEGYAGKNGATNYTYFIYGAKYTGTSRFDKREFSVGDMFLLYFDKTDPNKTDMPVPEVKILPIDAGADSICMLSLGINLEDFRLISNY